MNFRAKYIVIEIKEEKILYKKYSIRFSSTTVYFEVIGAEIRDIFLGVC